MIRIPNPLNRLFKDKTEVAIFFSAFLLEIAVGIYLIQRWGFTFVIEDAASHLYIPRTVIDNGNHSGFQNLGTVWLPIFHLLVMSLVLIDPFYTTGFAGTIVNALATGGICVILYRFYEMKKLGILASALFMVNIFTLIWGATPMDVQITIFFMLLATYYFKRYWEKDDVREFMKCSLAIILGTLTRYEVWAVALLVVLFSTWRELKNGQGYRIAYIHLPLWGIFAWLFWNLAIFRDPLMFIRHPTSTVAQGSQEILAYSGSILLTMQHVLLKLFINSGFLFLLALFSIIIFLAHKKMSRFTSLLLLTSPIFFHWYFMLIHVSTAWTRYFYIAYPGLVLSPLLFVETFDKQAFSKKRFKSGVKILMITLMFVSVFLAYPIQTKMLITGSGKDTRTAIAFPEYYELRKEMQLIKEKVKESPLLMANDPTFGPVYSPLTGISPAKIFDEYDYPLMFKVGDEPWKYSPFVMISKTPSKPFLEPLNEYYEGKYLLYNFYYESEWRQRFLLHYELVMETEHFLVYKRVPQ